MAKSDYGGSKSTSELLAEIRADYFQIYSWHKRRGSAQFDERFAHSQEKSEWASEYLAMLSDLAPPNSAAPEFMARVAREVLSGRFEWAYWERTSEGISLSDLARRILEKVGVLHKQLAEEKAEHEIAAFRNVSAEGELIRPLQISIPVRGNSRWNLNEYYEHADKVYHDIPESAEGVGGKVVLTETNAIVAKGFMEQYRFHNSKSLHFGQVEEPSALVNLARSGRVVIEAIKME